MPPSLKKEPSHFEVLSLTPTSLEGQDAPTQTKTVKQAYRRALLKHHPDKSQQAKAQDHPSSSSSSSTRDEQHYSVDQITEAYTTLSDTRQRREYIKSLKTESHTSSTFSSGSNQGNGSSSANGSQSYSHHQTFHASFKPAAQQQATPQASVGVESVDLDDFKWDGKKQVYYERCARCGTDRGYSFREMDLEEVGEDGELMVQCTGCSLWLRVLFEDADDDADAPRDVKQRSTSQGEDLKHTTSGSSSGKSGGWSWKFNLGISIGGGASASASAGRSS